jgi:AraC-like DNA-binding protein
VAPALPHSCTLLTSPFPGVHATDIDSARHYGKHWHSTFGFGVIDRGAHRSASAHGDVDAFEGDVVCTFPGEVHDGRPLGGPSRRWRNVYVEPEVFHSMTDASAPGSGRDVAFVRAAFTDARTRKAVTHLLEQLKAWTGSASTDRAALALACEEALAHACGLMLRHHSTAAPCNNDAACDLDLVCQRLADAPLLAPTLAELAALVGIGKFQLLRRFRRVYGTTPHDWLLQRRADRARGLIRNGVPLVEAAANAGFADQSHMTRVFVKRYGFTPGEWKKASPLSLRT